MCTYKEKLMVYNSAPAPGHWGQPPNVPWPHVCVVRRLVQRHSLYKPFLSIKCTNGHLLGVCNYWPSPVSNYITEKPTTPHIVIFSPDYQECSVCGIYRSASQQQPWYSIKWCIMKWRNERWDQQLKRVTQNYNKIGTIVGKNKSQISMTRTSQNTMLTYIPTLCREHCCNANKTISYKPFQCS